jgi:hypothetical protein
MCDLYRLGNKAENTIFKAVNEKNTGFQSGLSMRVTQKFSPQIYFLPRKSSKVTDILFASTHTFK